MLDRAAYLLTPGAAPGAAAPLLELILAAVLAGADAAGDVMACAGLTPALLALLGGDEGAELSACWMLLLFRL